MENDYDYEYDSSVYQNEIDDESDIGLRRGQSYNVLKGQELEEIENLRNTLINEVSEFTYLNNDEAIRLLIFYKWNIEDLKDKFYDCSEKILSEAGINQSQSSLKSLEKKGINPNNKECYICYCPETKLNPLYSLKCKHNFCSSCWFEYLEAKLSEINSLLFSTCPQENCNLYVSETVFYKFFDKNIKETTIFRKSLLKYFTEKNSNIKWCINPNCGACIRSTNKSSIEIDCVCGTNFCFRCLRQGHRPCSCLMTELWEKRDNEDSANVKWLHLNTKQCPKCSKFIEKNQGCNHMTCKKEAGGCGHEFCWLCFSDWFNHSTATHQNCNVYKAEKKSTNNSKFELEKFIFYFDRYKNHDKALIHALKLRNSICYYIEVLNQTKNLPLSELYFLNDAIESMIKSRKFLKYTYVFGFYMLELKEKKFFEHRQSLLESNTDRLHELLENETITNIMAIYNFKEFLDEFTNFKNIIINLSAATDKYLTNLMTEIENGMMHLIDNTKLK